MHYEEAETPWWHNYLCEDEECDQGSSGIVINVRTDYPSPPTTVRCPVCTSKMKYQSSWAASGGIGELDRPLSGDELVDSLRSFEPEEISSILEQIRVLEPWEHMKDEGLLVLRSIGAEEPVCFVKSVWSPQDGTVWNVHVDGDLFASTVTAVQATDLVEALLIERGYIVPWLE